MDMMQLAVIVVNNFYYYYFLKPMISIIENDQIVEM